MAQYVPWLNFTLIRSSSNSFLDLVCCTIASRHMEAGVRSVVAGRLQKLTEETVIKMIFNARFAESLESIQALLILALWAPICGSREIGIGDGRLLVASAVSMAMNLRLNEASARVMALRTAHERDVSSVNEMELSEITHTALLVSELTKLQILFHLSLS